jgi:hypothetical protein
MNDATTPDRAAETPIRLHRCSLNIKNDGHPCWKVQSALDDAGVAYEVVRHAPMGLRRKELLRVTGQKKLPAIEFPDGRVLREESAELAARIREGRLADARH